MMKLIGTAIDANGNTIYRTSTKSGKLVTFNDGVFTTLEMKENSLVIAEDYTIRVVTLDNDKKIGIAEKPFVIPAGFEEGLDF